MRALGVASLALTVLAASPALAATPVALWKVGDDGLTNRNFDALEKAFGAAKDFSLAQSGEGLVKVEITNHLAWRQDGGTLHATAPYSISRAGAAPLVGEATCTEATLPVCADEILSATRTYLKNR
ncbi:hypothetical protein [Caulobacter sp. DWR2-3-1b2]|uniref:hypothetical protein n=1 Tax=unclassified Caulobacter TaxID=2648921 RepID=UPI0019C02CC3|nr:hypothetical protein [Caulobacter sp.]